MAAVQTKILERIRRKGRGKVFIPKDFLDVGTREAADQTLSRLARGGDVQRLGRGLYYFPQINAKLGVVRPPDQDEIAQAIARQTGSRIVPSGAVAANRLGLSTQVPARPIYLTDGRSRQVRAGNVVFLVKHASPKELPVGSPTSAMVFQALRYLGKDAVDAGVVARLRRTLSHRQRDELIRDARYTTDWIADAVRKVVEPETEASGHG